MNMMNEIYSLFLNEENNLNDFLRYQVDFEPTNDIFMYARNTTKSEDIIKIALLLYPEFILVDDVILLKNNYSEKTWIELLRKYNNKEAANVVNHIHIEDFLPSEKNSKLLNFLGNVLSFFWKIALKNQFPNLSINVKFDGELINIIQ